MARRRSKNRHTTKTRVHPIDARANALRSFLGMPPQANLIETRRQPYAPAPALPRKAQKAARSLLAAHLSKKNQPTPDRPAVNLQYNLVIRPQQTVCSRRQARKEVIHAFNHAGKSGQKKPVRTATSTIICKGK